MSKTSTLPPNHKTPDLVELEYSTWHAAWAAARWPLWTTNNAQMICITTHSRTMQMSSPFLSLKVTWSSTVAMRIETMTSHHLHKKANKQHSESSQTARAAGLTSRPVPEEMPVLVTGSLYCYKLFVSVIVSVCVPVWVQVLERVCGKTTQAETDCVLKNCWQHECVASCETSLTLA